MVLLAAMAVVAYAGTAFYNRMEVITVFLDDDSTELERENEVVIKDNCEIRLPAYYGDGMVFQRGKKAPTVWGFTNCDPERVVVDVFCDNGRRTFRYFSMRKLK